MGVFLLRWIGQHAADAGEKKAHAGISAGKPNEVKRTNIPARKPVRARDSPQPNERGNAEQSEEAEGHGVEIIAAA